MADLDSILAIDPKNPSVPFTGGRGEIPDLETPAPSVEKDRKNLDARLKMLEAIRPPGPQAEDILPFAGEVAGATGMAGLAAAAGTSAPIAIPLAMIAAGMGGIAGREFMGSFFGKKMTTGEVVETGITSAISGGISAALKPLARMFTGVPHVSKTRRMMQHEIDRQQALQGFQIPGQFFRRVNAQKEVLASKAQKELDFIQHAPKDKLIAKYGSLDEAELALVRLNAEKSSALLNRVNSSFDPKLRKGLLEPEFTAGQAALMMQLPNQFPGSTVGALAFLYSSTLGGQGFLGAAEAGVSTAIVGWLLGRLGQNYGPALIRNVGFRNWVMGVNKNSVGEMLLTFISEVQMGAQTEKEAIAAEKFMGFLMDQVDNVVKSTGKEFEDIGKMVDQLGSEAESITKAGREIGGKMIEENTPIKIPIQPEPSTSSKPSVPIAGNNAPGNITVPGGSK